MSEGTAVALGLLVGFWGSTNENAVTLQMYDNASSTQIWSFNYKVLGSLGSSSARLVDNLMRSATKKMPYEYKNTK